jgi:hypothetical protein
MACIGVLAAGKGEPGIGVRTPVPAAMVNPATAAELVCVTYRNLVLGSTARPPVPGAGPAENGEPATADNDPLVELMVKASTVPLRKSETKRNEAELSTITPSVEFGPAWLPTRLGAPEVLSVNPEIVFAWLANRNVGTVQVVQL